MKTKNTYVYVKKRNMNAPVNKEEFYALVKRVANVDYADKIILEIGEDDGFDFYEVSDKDGKILIKSGSGVGFASGFNAYLKERCAYSVGALSVSGSLPETPPSVGEPIKRKSKFLYRYFFNYCTFCYTYAFDTWEEWEKTIDYLILSGYNLILNPIGIETVWRNTLLRMGYTKKETENFLCGPAFYAWQWMMNMTGWASRGAPDSWYEQRKELAGRINSRLHAFGASALTSAFIGMVPDDFTEHFPDAIISDQGYWCGMKRPSLMMPDSPHYDELADIYFEESKKIACAEHMHFYSADPFHEGGITKGIDLNAYGKKIFKKMSEQDKDSVWFFQGWTNSPKAEMITAVPEDRVIVTDLVAGSNHSAENLYAGAPWIYCEVFYYGGQNITQGNAPGILETPHECIEDEKANIIGLGFMSEAVNCNEIIYEILAYNAFAEKGKIEEFIPYYLKTKYGYTSERLEKTLLGFCREVINGTHDLNGESALCARATLETERTSSWANKPNPFMDQTPLVDYVCAMLEEYDRLGENAAFRRDLMEASRQAISNLSWHFVEMIRRSYNEKKLEALSYYGAELLSLYDIQTAIVSTDKNMLLGTWLEKAKRHGKTAAEKAYFEWNARTQITLWSHREGSVSLRDYAAREWQGMLEDFYRPRWETFISRLEISLLTDTPLEEVNYYDEEVPFTYRKKTYPTEPSGDLKKAVTAAISKICETKVSYKAETEKQASFEENVMETVSNEPI